MNIQGRKFGMLTAIRENGSAPFGHGRLVAAWLCKCECGRERTVAKPDLLREKVSHCDRRRAVRRGAEYNSYAALKGRCLNPKDIEFPNYGGRGITVCSRWLKGHKCNTGFECFLEDMGQKPSRHHSIDRIDNNGNYEPDNCRWATSTEQTNNTRRSVRINYRGREMTLTEASESIGVPYQTLRDRLFRYKMPLERAMQKIVTASRERT